MFGQPQKIPVLVVMRPEAIDLVHRMKRRISKLGMRNSMTAGLVKLHSFSRFSWCSLSLAHERAVVWFLLPKSRPLSSGRIKNGVTFLSQGSQEIAAKVHHGYTSFAFIRPPRSRGGFIALISTQANPEYSANELLVLAKAANHISFLNGLNEKDRVRPIHELCKVTKVASENELLELLKGSNQFLASDKNRISLVSQPYTAFWQPSEIKFSTGLRLFLSRVSTLEGDQKPRTKKKLKDFMNETIGGAYEFDLIARDTLKYGFASIDSGGRINWNMDRIQNVLDRKIFAGGDGGQEKTSDESEWSTIAFKDKKDNMMDKNLAALAKAANHISFLRGVSAQRPVDELAIATGMEKASLVELLNQSNRFSVSSNESVSLVPFPTNKRPGRNDLGKGLRLFLSRLSKMAPTALPTRNHDVREVVVDQGEDDSDQHHTILADSIYYGFASVDTLNQLNWNMTRIKEVLADNPPTLSVSNSAYSLSKGLVTFADQVRNGISFKNQWRLKDGTTCFYVSTNEELIEVTCHNPDIFQGETGTESVVVLDCEGIPDSLELVQIAYPSGVIIFDAQEIGVESLFRVLEPMLVSTSTLKVIHDLREDAFALFKFGNIKMKNVLDSQLVHEHLFKTCFAGMNEFLEIMGFETHENKSAVGRDMDLSLGRYWKQRPLAQEKLDYAALDVRCLFRATQKVMESLEDDKLLLLKEASVARAENALTTQKAAIRRISFDTAKNHKLTSAELLRLENPSHGIFHSFPSIENEADKVIALLPERFLEKLSGSDDKQQIDLNSLTDIGLDQDRRPECWVDGKRIFLSDNSQVTVTEQDIQYILDQVGEIGSDNRAGLDGELHRFSVIRARNDQVLGLTIRIGRSITGISDLLLDQLVGSEKSILLLGEPGSGKTTIVREAARILAEEKHVLVVDTSNEIGGHGIKPHNCIGLARRMMVRSLEEQSKVMIECVQNHTPYCMVVDEIGRKKEVLAASTVRQRGVRMIASAHGDLRKLVQNQELCGLVGGVQQVILGDGMAAKEALRRDPSGSREGLAFAKVKVERATDPTFDVIVELRRGLFDEWIVVTDVAKAVDSILDGRLYKAERRMRNSETGELELELIRS